MYEGVRLVRDVLEGSYLPLHWCIVEEGSLSSPAHEEIIAHCVSRSIPVYRASAADLRLCSDTMENQGVVLVGEGMIERLDEDTLSSAPDIVTVLMGAQDPGNVGTVVRTCDWFGQPLVVLTGSSVDPTNAKVLRASMGSCTRVRIVEEEDPRVVFEVCRRMGRALVSTVVNGGTPLPHFRRPSRMALVLGSEAHGLEDDLQSGADHRVSIPRRGRAESLNLAISHAVFLGHFAMETG